MRKHKSLFGIDRRNCQPECPACGSAIFLTLSLDIPDSESSDDNKNKDNKNNNPYITCPGCGRKIYLKVNVY